MLFGLGRAHRRFLGLAGEWSPDLEDSAMPIDTLRLGVQTAQCLHSQLSVPGAFRSRSRLSASLRFFSRCQQAATCSAWGASRAAASREAVERSQVMSGVLEAHGATGRRSPLPGQAAGRWAHVDSDPRAGCRTIDLRAPASRRCPGSTPAGRGQRPASGESATGYLR